MSSLHIFGRQLICSWIISLIVYYIKFRWIRWWSGQIFTPLPFYTNKQMKVREDEECRQLSRDLQTKQRIPVSPKLETRRAERLNPNTCYLLLQVLLQNLTIWTNTMILMMRVSEILYET